MVGWEPIALSPDAGCGTSDCLDDEEQAVIVLLPSPDGCYQCTSPQPWWDAGQNEWGYSDCAGGCS